MNKLIWGILGFGAGVATGVAAVKLMEDDKKSTTKSEAKSEEKQEEAKAEATEAASEETEKGYEFDQEAVMAKVKESTANSNHQTYKEDVEAMVRDSIIESLTKGADGLTEEGKARLQEYIDITMKAINSAKANEILDQFTTKAPKVDEVMANIKFGESK